MPSAHQIVCLLFFPLSKLLGKTSNVCTLLSVIELSTHHQFFVLSFVDSPLLRVQDDGARYTFCTSVTYILFCRIVIRNILITFHIIEFLVKIKYSSFLTLTYKIKSIAIQEIFEV